MRAFSGVHPANLYVAVVCDEERAGAHSRKHLRKPVVEFFGHSSSPYWTPNDEYHRRTSVTEQLGGHRSVGQDMEWLYKGNYRCTIEGIMPDGTPTIFLEQREMETVAPADVEAWLDGHLDDEHPGERWVWQLECLWCRKRHQFRGEKLGLALTLLTKKDHMCEVTLRELDAIVGHCS